MNYEPGWSFDPAQIDAERMAAFDAPLYVIEPDEAPRLLGWSWEVHNDEPIFGEAGYVTDTGGPIRIRTWKSAPGGTREAINAHLADLISNVGAGAESMTDANDTTVLVNGTSVTASASTLGRFLFLSFTYEGLLITMAHPVASATPTLTTLVREPPAE
ncbi:hypothetical protein [Agromyces silvae]|uniref:hypothetical protein n=1 Tax=Agromyces silvae TaxID=3388266 RepID=UPI00280C050E|nr:hypothetical protein [Agromyces protaetiae]